MAKRPAVWLLFLGLFGPTAQGLADDEAAKKDLEKLQGVWLTVDHEKDGRRASVRERLQFVNQTLEIKGNVAIFISGKDRVVARFKIDPTQKPKHIDLFTDLLDKTPKMVGIYEIEGDEFKFAWINPADSDRMEEFKTLPGASQRISFYKRAPEKKEEVEKSK